MGIDQSEPDSEQLPYTWETVGELQQPIFCWRVLPALALYLYGVGVLIDALMYLTMTYGFGAATIWRDLPQRPTERFSNVFLLIAAHVGVAAGTLFLVAGRDISCRRWRRGIVMALLAVVFCGIIGGTGRLLMANGGLFR